MGEIKKLCFSKKKIKLFGDIPFYINHDSADCWSYSEFFKLDEEKQPEKVSGVPPDYFSETGQLWGTPSIRLEAAERR
ncbi:4-alpha-glucanotransferase [Antarcticibacterium sp. 1MA-6-2]|uniref:4-alpha-glucanotransferase n=1 Tax=Antarcticibacterium sp. 1MA-6-2 TaxID=2908210 RepID=UPI001F253B2F|nr:4-alpha-glucanotransferase [Antarcticibacterium sp. 1MA-6-2]UJH91807.1 4-alpha-glucanotransferase [Antarcticibacterium sp. 1MA-6-2]